LQIKKEKYRSKIKIPKKKNMGETNLAIRKNGKKQLKNKKGVNKKLFTTSKTPV